VTLVSRPKIGLHLKSVNFFRTRQRYEQCFNADSYG